MKTHLFICIGLLGFLAFMMAFIGLMAWLSYKHNWPHEAHMLVGLVFAMLAISAVASGQFADKERRADQRKQEQVAKTTSAQ